MKILWKKLIFCIAIPLVIGILSSLLTFESMASFKLLNKPVAAPPGWLFSVVWTILYILMGIASYLVITSKKPDMTALIIYGVQLIFNFFWSILFFNLKLCLLAFIWLVLLWFLILKTTVLFYQSSKTAGYLMIPYLLWVLFAGYLNLSICILN